MKNIEDIRLFFYTLSNLRWSPDDNFHAYTRSDGSRMFTPDEAQNINRLMAEAFQLCSDLGADIYDLSSNYQDIPPQQNVKGDIGSYDYKLFSWQ